MASTLASPFPIDEIRRQFPALGRRVGEEPAVFFDGPAGSQVPQGVIDEVGLYLARTNANSGGAFVTSRESDEVVRGAQQAVADFLGAASADEIVFGANMTTLTLALSRALARTWKPGDEIVVTRLDHDANVTPWQLAAADAGATCRLVEVRPGDCTLDLDDLAAKITDRTRLVAVGAASNLVGTVNPVAEIARRAHAVGALVFVDAVHYAPHGRIDVAAWDCDFLCCSAYKFFGPHVGILWGRQALLESTVPYQVRPALGKVPGSWMTGTQNLEGIAGTRAAIEYLAWLGRTVGAGHLDRRAALDAAAAAIVAYERELARRLLAGLVALDGVTVWGITAPDRLAERVPTVAFTHASAPPAAIAGRLAKAGVFTWAGNSYALPLTEALGLEPGGVVRIGLLHYNTAGEVDRVLARLPRLLSS